MATPFLVSLGFVALFLFAGCATTQKEDGSNATGEGNETSSLLPAESLSGKGGKGKQDKPSGSPADQPSGNEASPVASGSRIPGSSKNEKAPILTGEGSSDLESPKDELAEGPDVSTDPAKEEPGDFAEGVQSFKANEDAPLRGTAKNDPAQTSPSRPPVIEKGPEALVPDVDKVVAGEPNPLPGKHSGPETGPSVDSFFKPVSPVTDLPGPNGVPLHDHPADGTSLVPRDPSEPVSSNDPGDDIGLPSDSEPSVEVPKATVLRNLDQGNDSSIVLRPSATDDEEDTVTRGIHLSDTVPQTESVLPPPTNAKSLFLSLNLGSDDVPGINPGKAVDFSTQALQSGDLRGNETVPRVGFLDPSGSTSEQNEARKTIGFSGEKNSSGFLRPPSWKDLDGVPLSSGGDSRPSYDSLRRLLDAGKKGEAEISPNQRKVRDFSGIEELLKAREGENDESPSGLEKDGLGGARYQNALQWLRSRGLTENGKKVD
jgi:hypothetical protein